MGQKERAQQRNTQDPRHFHAYLDTLEKYSPELPEEERALVFFTKLQPELR
jgi:hypothetical protein